MNTINYHYIPFHITKNKITEIDKNASDNAELRFNMVLTFVSEFRKVNETVIKSSVSNLKGFI